MLKKLLGATALGVVMTAGIGLTAQAQAVVDPDVACRTTGPHDALNSDGTPALDDLNNQIFGDGLECGEDAEATDAFTTAVGNDAKALAQRATSIGDNAFVAETARNGTAIGREAVIDNRVDSNPEDDIDDAIDSINSTAVGQKTYVLGSRSTAIGQSAKVEGEESTAVGQDAEVTGNESTGIGQDAKVTGDKSTALGEDASIEGDQSTALGGEAVVQGDQSTAVGELARVEGERSTSLGQFARVVGDQSTALGQEASVEGDKGLAVGQEAKVEGDSSTAIGENAEALADRATAIGQNAEASALQSTALGENSIASGIGATALGNQAQAAFDNSTAIGFGAQTLFANQFMFGTASNIYTMPGLTSEASREAQDGPLYLVLTDASGNLAIDGSNTLNNILSDISANKTAISSGGGNTPAVAAVQATANQNQERISRVETSLATNGNQLSLLNAQFEALGQQVSLNTEQIQENTAGIAIANAMAGTSWLQANETHALTANWGYYNNSNAFAISATQRLNKNWSANMGVGVSTDEGKVGARAGLRFGW